MSIRKKTYDDHEPEGESATYKLMFAEPDSFDYDGEDYIILHVDQKMYNRILAGADEYYNKNGRAYTFGPVYDIDLYKEKHKGFHTCKNGRTGLIDARLAKIKNKTKKSTTDYNDKYKYESNDPNFIKAISLDYPEIKWIGSVGNDRKTSHVYFHIDKQNDRIDSIIIDANHFMKVIFENDEFNNIEDKNSSDEDSDDSDNNSGSENNRSLSNSDSDSP